MSKKSFNRHRDSFDYEEENRENGYHDHLVERRRLKRMKTALRTKNIDQLLELDDDQYDF
jgi:hypothetical protein